MSISPLHWVPAMITRKVMLLIRAKVTASSCSILSEILVAFANNLWLLTLLQCWPLVRLHMMH